MDKNEFYKSAIGYARLGYHVFPCVSGGKTPLTKHGYKEATLNIQKIKHWWLKWPQANVAIATNDMLVIDIDGKENKWPTDEKQAEDLEDTPIAATPRGGRHHIFQLSPKDKLKNTVSKIAKHVDTRTNGGYIVVSPSIIDGKQYEWVNGLCHYDKLPEPEQWLLDLLYYRVGYKDVDLLKINSTDGNIIEEGQRNSVLTSMAGTVRRIGLKPIEIESMLISVNKNRCKPQLHINEIRRIVTSICSYEPDQISVAITENHYDVMNNGNGQPKIKKPSAPDPLPYSMLRIPGFISELIDHCLTTAPYPNQTLAFAGALALQSFLGARKFRDSGDNRTNLYILGLAYSAAGKDWPRKLNINILDKLNQMKSVGDRFASGEGIQDALYLSPAMLFQTDEIDQMLATVSNTTDTRNNGIISTLLTLYTSANTIYPMRRKASQEESQTINQPSLTIFGTAIPNHYYSALSEQMLTNGFFARMLILEGGKRSEGQEPQILDIPDRIINTAKKWNDLRTGTGNLESFNPDPIIVEHSAKAKDQIIQIRLYAEEQYKLAEDNNDPVSTTVWGRVSEMVRKLSLIYAISCNPDVPIIDNASVLWAGEFVITQTKRMLYNSCNHVSHTDFHSQTLKIKNILNKQKNCLMNHSKLLQRMHMKTKEFRDIVDTMVQSDQLRIVSSSCKNNKRKISYQLP